MTKLLFLTLKDDQKIIKIISQLKLILKITLDNQCNICIFKDKLIFYLPFTNNSGTKIFIAFDSSFFTTYRFIRDNIGADRFELNVGKLSSLLNFLETAKDDGCELQLRVDEENHSNPTTNLSNMTPSVYKKFVLQLRIVTEMGDYHFHMDTNRATVTDNFVKDYADKIIQNKSLFIKFMQNCFDLKGIMNDRVALLSFGKDEVTWSSLADAEKPNSFGKRNYTHYYPDVILHALQGTHKILIPLSFF